MYTLPPNSPSQGPSLYVEPCCHLQLPPQALGEDEPDLDEAWTHALRVLESRKRRATTKFKLQKVAKNVLEVGSVCGGALGQTWRCRSMLGPFNC